MSFNPPHLSVVLPAKNESAAIGATVEKILAQLEQQGVSEFEVLVVNDGSTDDTAAVAAAHGARVLSGQRVESLQWQAPHWLVDGQPFDHVLIATSAPNAVQLAVQSAQFASTSIANQLHAWSHRAARLRHQAITTVYAQAAAPAPRLRAPMLALRPGADAPAQFVFDRDAITPTDPPTRLLAFVVSDSRGERTALEAAITTQAARQLKVQVTPLLTVTEKRATFACTPGLQRPAASIAPGLSACGDYITGPYPATLEGAVRSGLQVAETLP